MGTGCEGGGNGENDAELAQIRLMTSYRSDERYSSFFQEHKKMCWSLRGRQTPPEI